MAFNTEMLDVLKSSIYAGSKDARARGKLLKTAGGEKGQELTTGEVMGNRKRKTLLGEDSSSTFGN